MALVNGAKPGENRVMEFVVYGNKLSSQYAAQSIFKVTSGSASTKEVMRERLKDEWLPNHNG